MAALWRTAAARPVTRDAAGRVRTVVFDCDSTLSEVEGIEELAAERRQEIVALTEAAMMGEVPLEEVYGRRMAIVRPDRARLEALGRRYVERLVPDARETAAALRVEGVEVRVVSSGLLPAVRFVAGALGLPDDAAAAVDVFFDDDGGYAGFDESSPLAASGGKCAVLERWAPPLPRPVMMVGDGANDLDARAVVDRFVAFAGVIERPKVAAAADVVIRSRSLAPVVALAFGSQPPTDPSALEVYQKGRRLLDGRSADHAGE